MIRRFAFPLLAGGLVALTLSLPAAAHTLSGTFTASDGCKFDWVDIDDYAIEAADMVERGETCLYIRAKIRVLEAGTWITRQDTDTSHAYVAGSNSTDLDWVDHNWRNPSPWKGFRRDH